ncbi:UDP-glucose--hexose-1-phosphate uridylyltransferase [Clostridium estertheticum]|uniref:UDP-glucose--hexose-1-phosphate uridylyltransferase n=1 Tax=Clostridium estertheticum TaxID=238834 RepID=UPI001C6E287C|nr:UDP-glucose--hexose-1-phosphate uridylyltransferase [Clostridium estertheticum]MBW9151986.1 UDP-glucose--hexose-1-phosphate uridylyltransferase [Clostridium estertheticum]WLC85021.1 UDP-glucose--hexose-1-phosphate uridylyltransferase [Clostridium estertheticum]
MAVNISSEVQKLIYYAINKQLITSEDLIYTKNRLLETLSLDEIKEENIEDKEYEVQQVLDNINLWACDNKVINDDGIIARDLFDTKIMACLIGRPSEIIKEFKRLYKESPKKATDYFYKLSISSNYIRWERVQKDLKWKVATSYGDIDITINLSKPEKDPKEIARAKNLKSSDYPSCLLCKENEGYAGRINHPARGNHRLIPVTLDKDKWFLQYSPYVYYNEHCIILNGEHVPMKICKETFKRLLDFVEQYPHYFVGSNADLPIVGGSILSHDHFQGGNYEFAMAKAPIEEEFNVKGYEGVTIGRVNWPMSVVRINGKDKETLVKLADHILKVWKNYSDESVSISAFTGEAAHNAITPIARRRGESYEIDLVLRNNRISAQYPDGIFHPHKELHNIKKENIGLIEVMGLAVLPARLKTEIKELSYYLVNNKDKNIFMELDNKEDLIKHKEWAIKLTQKYSAINEKNVDEILRKEIGIVFSKVLEQAGVFKTDVKGKQAFNTFINSL